MEKNRSLMTKSGVALALVLALFLALAAPTLFFGRQVPSAAAEVEGKTGTKLSANGQGVIRIEPDMASIAIGVTVTKPTASEASAGNGEIMNAVLEAVKAEGIEEKDIATSRYNIWPRYDYSGDSRQMVGYEASNVVNVTVRDLAKLAAVLDAAIGAGANDVNQIQFDRADKKDAYEQALKAAVENALGKVSAMAEAAGLEGTPVPREIGEVTYQAMPVYAAFEEMAVGDAEGGTPIQSGQLTVTADVSIVCGVGDE